MLKKHGFNIGRGFLAFMMFAGGAAKLAGVPEVLQSFSVLGLPSWFGYFIGACEVAGAIGLFITPLSALAAVGISIIMLGAVYFHVAHTPIIEAIPAVLALTLAVFVAIKQRSKVFKFN
jgi:putative oxidoreductase